MITSSRIMLPLVALALMAACTSNPRVQSDYDSDLDFGQYKTFDFSSSTEIEDPDLTGILELYFSAAVMQQLLTKGLVQSDDPDMLINVSADIEDVRRSPRKSRGNGPCLNYDKYRGGNLGLYRYTGESRTPFCIYSEGSIAVNMVDVELNRTIWEGVCRVRLDEKDRGASLLQSVTNDVGVMFRDRTRLPRVLW